MPTTLVRTSQTGRDPGFALSQCSLNRRRITPTTTHPWKNLIRLRGLAFHLHARPFLQQG
jgi:hypothetical protein